MKAEHKIMIVFALAMYLMTSCATAGPAFPANGIMPMGTGATLELWNAAVNGLHLAEMWRVSLADGYGYMALQAHEGWFGVVLKSTSNTCTGPCLQELLGLNGNAVTPQNLEELVDHARSVGFEKVAPTALPAAMRMAAAVLHETWSAAQLATGWIIILPNAVFDTDEFLPEKAKN